MMLDGCTVMTPKTEGVERCQDHLRAEIELALPEPRCRLAASPSSTVDHVTLRQHGTLDGRVRLHRHRDGHPRRRHDRRPSSATCSSPVIDGRTRAALQTINGDLHDQQAADRVRGRVRLARSPAAGRFVGARTVPLVGCEGTDPRAAWARPKEPNPQPSPETTKRPQRGALLSFCGE